MDNLSFCLEEGEHVSIIGRNGCGKSTLLKCLSNFLNYRGSVKLCGVEIKDIGVKKLARKITILPQKNDLYFDYKVYDFIKFGLYSHQKIGFTNKRDDNFIDDILRKLDIYKLKYRYISELSGGECQMVFIARVFVQDTDVVLFDEMNNNLDINSQIYTIENINTWFKDKILISVFHDLNLVRNLNSKVMVIKNSKIYRYGSVDEVFTSELLENIYGVDVRGFMMKSLEKWGSCR